MLAQQTQPGAPNPDELKKKASKAMDKDDEKKMGGSKFSLFKEVRKGM